MYNADLLRAHSEIPSEDFFLVPSYLVGVNTFLIDKLVSATEHLQLISARRRWRRRWW